MSYYYFNVGFLNWWWRWRVGSRDPKVGPTTSVDHHYKLMESYNIYIYLNTHRWGCSQLWHGPSNLGVDEG